MPTYRTGTVTGVVQERTGLQRVTVILAGEEARAYVLTALTGPVAQGDEVVLNTTAVELGLGTGGWHVVHWNLTRREWAEPGPGHIMKLRYTSLQADTGAAEDADPGHLPADIRDVPVVACSLHSQLPIVAMAVKHLRPDARISYVMTDGAALPLALSDLVADLVAHELLDGTVTAGHAFGGDLEAVTVPSALTVAVGLQHADVVVVAMGPGVVGTGTALGTTAVEVASILGWTRSLGGVPIACVRVSDGDERERHRGISHHTRTALALTPVPVLVALPPSVPPAELASDSGSSLAHHQVQVIEPPDAAALLAVRGIRVTTMGRGADEEPRFFAAAAAAGALAARLLGPPSGRS